MVLTFVFSLQRRMGKVNDTLCFLLQIRHRHQSFCPRSNGSAVLNSDAKFVMKNNTAIFQLVNLNLNSTHYFMCFPLSISSVLWNLGLWILFYLHRMDVLSLVVLSHCGSC